MRATEIIRGMLDKIDGVETQQPVQSTVAYSDRDVKRFKQIVDLADQGETTPYSNTPNEQYADISAVTHDAGAINVNGTKEPEDLRGNSFRLYPSKDREQK